MGYGLNTQLYNNRKWGTVITWRYDPINTLPKNPYLVAAMSSWEVSCGISFQQVTLATTPVDFVVSCKQQGSRWCNEPPGGIPLNEGGGCGKPKPNVVGQLNIKPTTELGSILHEVGHLLGLSHEHDYDNVKARTHYSNPQNSEGVGLTIDELVDGASDRRQNLQTYGTYDTASVMMYPEGHYKAMKAPSPGDVAAVKAINGWPP